MSCKHGNWAPCELCDAESALEMRIEELELERDALLEQLESARANTRLIAACDPDTIRELLAERDQLAAVALAACDAVDDLIEKWYATRESGCLPNQVVRARGASKLLRAIALEGTKNDRRHQISSRATRPVARPEVGEQQ